MEQLLAQFLEHLRYERNVSEHTLRNYAIDLGQFLGHLAPADPRTGVRRELDVRAIDHITIREWMSELHSEQKKKTSIARKLAALRTFFQFLMREGVVEANPAKLVSTPRLEKKLPTHLSVEDAVRFIETPDVTTDLGKRDRAILEMLYGTGVRVSELVKLDMKDIDFQRAHDSRQGQAAQGAHSALRRARAAFADEVPDRSAPGVPQQRAARRARHVSRLPKLSGHAHHDALGRPHGGQVHQNLRGHPRHKPALRCATPSPRTCSTAAQTSATYKSCSATRASRPHKSTPTSPWRN